MFEGFTEACPITKCELTGGWRQSTNSFGIKSSINNGWITGVAAVEAKAAVPAVEAVAADGDTPAVEAVAAVAAVEAVAAVRASGCSSVPPTYY